MNKKLGIGIVVCAIVAVAMVVGCIEVKTAPEATPESSPNPTPTPLPEPKYSRGDVLPLIEGEITPDIYNRTTKSGLRIHPKEEATTKTVIRDYYPTTDRYAITCVIKEGDKYYFCPGDCTRYLDRLSLERNVSGEITSFILLFNVRSWDDYAKTHLSVEEIKNKAITLDYRSGQFDDLIRHDEEYIGKIFHPQGEMRVFQVTEDSKKFDRYHLLMSNWKSDAFWVNYVGERPIEGDIFYFWGEFKGLRTYKTVRGDAKTVPEFDALHVGFKIYK